MFYHLIINKSWHWYLVNFEIQKVQKQKKKICLPRKKFKTIENTLFAEKN